MVGSGPGQSGPGLTRLDQIQDPQTHNTPGRGRADAECEPIVLLGVRATGMGCTGSVQLGPVYPSLNTPIIRQPEGGNYRGVGIGSMGSV